MLGHKIVNNCLRGEKGNIKKDGSSIQEKKGKV